MSYPVVEKILSTHRGTRFVKADLHIHTPASKDWDEKNPEEQFKSHNVNPKQIVESALAAGLDLIAITDHNSVEWCKNVIDAAADTPLVVLPGFELTVKQNVHLLAIFEQNKEIVDLEDLLVTLGIDRKQFGHSGARSNFTLLRNENGFYSLVKQITDAGGIAIPAHIDNDSGLIGKLKSGADVEEFLLSGVCRILEVTKDSLPNLVTDIVRNDARSLSIIRNSDAHRLDKIGSRSTWLKVDPKPDRNGKPRYLDSLKQIGFEPSTHIQLSDEDPSKKAQIVGCYSNGGMLKDQTICFNEELNCIIGGRGAGKSTLLDYLRFVLGDEPDAEELRQKLLKRYVDLIGESTTVYVLVEDSNDDLWLYERQLKHKVERQRGRDSINIISPKASKYQVFKETQDLFKFSEDDPQFSVDFYGQGEVQSITNQAETSRQLKLVDNFANTSIAQREERIEDYSQKLDEIEDNLADALDEREKLKDEISKLEDIYARIEELESSLEKDIFKRHQVWADADEWVREALKLLVTS